MFLHSVRFSLLFQMRRILLLFPFARRSRLGFTDKIWQPLFQNFHLCVLYSLRKGTVGRQGLFLEHWLLAVAHLVFACLDVFHELLKTLLGFMSGRSVAVLYVVGNL